MKKVKCKRLDYKKLRRGRKSNQAVSDLERKKCCTYYNVIKGSYDSYTCIYRVCRSKGIHNHTHVHTHTHTPA